MTVPHRTIPSVTEAALQKLPDMHKFIRLHEIMIEGKMTLCMVIAWRDDEDMYRIANFDAETGEYHGEA
jgi:hypothetical protein